MDSQHDVDGQQTKVTVWRVVEAAAVIIVLAFFLYHAQSVLNPVLLFALLWAVMLPFRGKDGHTALLTVAGLLTLIWLLSTTGSLLAPFVLSLVLAYMLDPLVDPLEQRKVPRSLAIGILTLPAIGVLVLFFLVVLPAAIGQLGQLIEDVPSFFERLANWLEGGRDRLMTLNLPFLDEDAVLERLRAIDSEAVVSFLQERQAALGSWIWSGVLGLGRGLGSIFTILGYVALTPVLTFYLLRDWDDLTETLAGLLPAHRRDDLVEFASESNTMVARYLRGQVTVAITIGLVTALGLWAVGFPYAGTLGLIVAIFSVVPYLGLVLSLIPALFIALVSGSVAVSLLKVAGVYGAAQLLEASVISPRIVGDSVGLHPVWVVLALALGGFFFGFVGLLIGVPVAAMTKLLVIRGLGRYKASAYYRGESAA